MAVLSGKGLVTASGEAGYDPMRQFAELARDVRDPYPMFAGIRARYADVLRGYLRSETIAPLPLQRLAAAHPDTADAVFRKILRQRDFTWAEHGEALMRRRKAWYYQREPRPGVSVIGTRLSELARARR